MRASSGWSAKFGFWIFIFLAGSPGAFLRANAQPLEAPHFSTDQKEAADRMNRAAKGALAPVYPYLADFLVQEYGLAEKPGIGIDLGSGPGDLILELAARTTSMYWINADINPFALRLFLEEAGRTGWGHRVGALFADAHRMPFRNDYADVIISRGAYHFWEDKILAFAEILRVLKPGGIAFVGRGFSGNMPVEVARQVRQEQKGMPQYDVETSEAELRSIMAELGIREYRVIRPRQQEPEIVYGLWVAFSKNN